MKLKKHRYLYFMKPVGMDGPIKIGCSYKPAARLVALSIWSPFPLEIIGVAKGGFEEERALHAYFAADLIHREWFTASPLLLACIRAIVGGEPVSEVLVPLARAA